MDRRDISKNKFDQTFREKLGELEHQPPAANWDAIESEVPTKKSFLWTGRYWVILVLTTLMFSSLSYTLNWHQQEISVIDRSQGGMMGEPMAALASLEATALQYTNDGLSISTSTTVATAFASAGKKAAKHLDSHGHHLAHLELDNDGKPYQSDRVSQNSGGTHTPVGHLTSEHTDGTNGLLTTDDIGSTANTEESLASSHSELAESLEPLNTEQDFTEEQDVLELALLRPRKGIPLDAARIAKPMPSKIAKLKSRGLFIGAVGQFYYSKVMNASTNLQKQNISRLRTSHTARGLRAGFNFNSQLSLVGEYHFQASQGQRYRNLNRGSSGEEDVALSLIQIPVYLEMHKYLGQGLTGHPINLSTRFGVQYSRLKSANINTAYRAASNTNAEDFLKKHYMGLTVGMGANFHLSNRVFFAVGFHGVAYRDIIRLNEMSKTLTTSNYHINFGGNASLNFLIN